MARPKISEETKQKMAELRDSANIVTPPPPSELQESSSPVVNTLGQIYDLMVQKRILELKKRRDELDLKIKEKEEEDNFNELLVKSLKPKKEKPKKKVPAKKPKKERPSLFSALATTTKVAGAGVIATTVIENKKREEEKQAAKAVTTTTEIPEQKVEEPSVKKPTAVPTEPSKEEPKTKVTPISGMDDVKQMVKRHEGVRNKPYKDSLGLWTVGVGHLIGDGKSLPKEWDRTFSDKEVNDLFEGDFAHHVKIAEQTPGYSKSNDGGKAAFIDLAFNMGKWWPKWPSTKKKLEEGDFQQAAAGLKDSKWYQQVGNRAKEIVALVSQAGDGKSTPSTGVRLAAASETNKDMKDQLQKDKITQVATTNKTLNVNQTQTAQSSPSADDKSPYDKKKAIV